MIIKSGIFFSKMTIMKYFLLFTLFFLLVYSSKAQEKNTRLLDNFRVQHYLLRDSLGIFIIKETINSDGSKSYSLIPKSHLDNLEPMEENYPPALIEWFSKEKSSINRQRKSSQLNSGRKSGIIDTSGTFIQKKNNTIWWILGSSAVLGGITAYYFLQTNNNIEELPIQPNPPK